MAVLLMVRRMEARPYRALGRRLAQARAAVRLTQRELAALSHVSEGYIPQIEGGRRRPDPAILRRLAGALDLDYQELATLAGFIDRSPEQLSADAIEVRRFEEYPAWLKRWLNKLADSMLRDVPLRDQNHTGADGYSNE